MLRFFNVTVTTSMYPVSIHVAMSSQPAKAVWIEILIRLIAESYIESQPAKAVWIEIPILVRPARPSTVTACEGCVD